MIADYFTKPLQGRLFKKLRDYIMGNTVIPLEERVENNPKRNEENHNMAIRKTVKERGETYAKVVKGKAKNEGCKPVMNQT